MFGGFEATAEDFGDDLGVVIGQVGWPGACVRYSAYVVEVFGEECFPFAMICRLYSPLKVCDREFGCAWGT